MSRDFIFRIKRGEALPPADPSGSRVLFNEEKQSFEILSNSGNVNQIVISGGTSAPVVLVNPVTYDELVSLIDSSSLTPGAHYLITDYKTCYDQPDFDAEGSSIVSSDNYKVGPTEPILVLATSVNTISSDAYQPTYPNDKIKYDWSWNQTEATSSPAFGRITERIDDRGNRADYDFRTVQFKRYEGFYCEQFYSGTISIDSEGLVTGVNTLFNSNFSAGDILAVYSPYNSPIGCFRYYEILSVTDDLTMNIAGTNIFAENAVGYSKGRSFGRLSPFKNNLTSEEYSGYNEYYTFDEDNSYNTYLGNYASLYESDGNTFLLSNNVFLDGSYENNVFGDGVFSNTFDDDMDSNITGSYFEFNVINDDFDRNQIGTRFRRNIIICDMRDNRIGNNFNNNILGDDDGYNFDNNLVGDYFERNFFTFSNGDFENNSIGESFRENIINDAFQDNIIVGNFYENIVLGIFEENKIGYDFYQNSIYNNLRKNNIGSDFNNNTIGNIESVNGYSFENNEILNNFKGNNILQNFWSNRLKTDFKGNIISQEFGYNNIGFGCVGNTFSGETVKNTIHDYFGFNLLSGSFSYNTIGSGFYSNEIGDGFGFGGSQNQGNIIGNNFYDNSIGEYFYNNFVRDNFYGNTLVDYFQQNNVTNDVNFTDFTSATHVYGYYNCNIFRRSDNVLKLSYYDAMDTVVITNINN